MSTVWVLGGATFDLLVSDLPRQPEVDRIGDEFTDLSLVHLPHAPVQSVGGNGANTAYVLGRLGVPAHVCTSIGNDPLGLSLRKALRDAGCEVTLLPPGRTSVNFVVTDEAGGRRSFFYPVILDASATLALGQSCPFAPGDHVALTGYPHPDARALRDWARAAHGAGASVSLDIGPTSAGFRLTGLLPLLDELDLLFCNERELAALEPGRNAEQLAADVANRLRVGLVVKMGSAGAEFHSRTGRLRVPATRVNCGTTVGAGDAYDAGFIFATLLNGQEAASGLRFASALVALMLESGRGVSGAPTAEQVAAFLSVRGDESAHDVSPSDKNAAPEPDSPTEHSHPPRAVTSVLESLN